MGFVKNKPPKGGQVNHPLRRTQRTSILWVIAGLTVAALAACATAERVADDTFSVSNFAGMAAADEPQAVLVGRDILSLGGTATDAAVAMAFTMTVTLPSQVSLGSSGACLVFDRGQKMVNAILFVPPLAGPTGDPSILPGMPRGMFLLHAKYGHVVWAEVLGTAQRMAVQGVPASRAFVRQFAPVSASVLADPVARAVFTRADGEAIGEGDRLLNPQLGATIGHIALHGVGEFYSGNWSRDFIAAAHQAGATFGEADMRPFAAQAVAPLGIPYGHEMAYFAPPPALTGIPEAQIWAHFAETGDYKDAKPDLRPGLVGASFARAIADRAQWLKAPISPADAIGKAHVETVMAGLDANQSPAELSSDEPVAGAGLVTVDNAGSAVACEFTLNRPFGTGSMVPGFGIYLPAPSPDVGLGLGPMLAINQNSNEFRFAAAASGGPSGARSLIRVAADTLLADRPLLESVAALHDDQSPGRVEAARCGSGHPTLERCSAATDPRGSGLAQTMAQR